MLQRVKVVRENCKHSSARAPNSAGGKNPDFPLKEEEEKNQQTSHAETGVS